MLLALEVRVIARTGGTYPIDTVLPDEIGLASGEVFGGGGTRSLPMSIGDRDVTTRSAAPSPCGSPFIRRAEAEPGDACFTTRTSGEDRDASGCGFRDELRDGGVSGCMGIFACGAGGLAASSLTSDGTSHPQTRNNNL